MSIDARISTGLPNHPKTKKLVRRLGAGAAWHLVCLFLWAAANRTDGDLTGMTDEDIELAIDWTGDPGAFVRECADIGFLDGEEGGRRIHDWQQHNPWAAGSQQRSEKSRWAALCKKYGRLSAAAQMPDYAQRMGYADFDGAPGKENPATGTESGATGTATGTEFGATGRPEPDSGTEDALPDSATGMPLAGFGSAPSPLPSPSPSPTPTPTSKDTMGGKPPDPEFTAWFLRFWAEWPRNKRKGAKGECFTVWKQRNYERIGETILAHIAARLKTDWTKQNCEYVEAPLVYLRGRSWDGSVLLEEGGPGSESRGLVL